MNENHFPFFTQLLKKKLNFPFFFYIVNAFTQKRTRVIAHLRFANARSWLVVLVTGKIATDKTPNADPKCRPLNADP